MEVVVKEETVVEAVAAARHLRELALEVGELGQRVGALAFLVRHRVAVLLQSSELRLRPLARALGVEQRLRQPVELTILLGLDGVGADGGEVRDGARHGRAGKRRPHTWTAWARRWAASPSDCARAS